MADISAEIAAFKGAVYGEEVRDSLVTLANKLNNEVTNNTTNIDKAFYYIGQLTSSDDLDTLSELGIYTFVASALPQHVPDGYTGSARLLNIKYYTNSSTTSVHSQMFIGNDRCLYYRIKIAENSTFSPWQVLNGPGSVTSAHISDGAIKTAKLADQSVTADKIANYTITTNKIATQAIDVGRLASNSVSTYKIQNGAVTADKIAANAISMSKLDDTLNKLLTTIVTPEQYGAVGDGVTDDTAALLLAIKTNRTVVFGMKKTYLVTGLTIQDTYNVIIQGNNSTLLLPYENSNNKTILGFVHCTYINVYDLKVATNFGTDNQALDISELFSTAPYGISMINNSSYMRIVNCEVSMVKDGISANDSNRILISQCRVRNVGQEPIAVRQCDGVIIEKNDLYWHTGDCILVKAYSFDRFYDITIRDNRLYYPKQSTPSSLGSLIMGGGITINAENTSTSYLTKGIIITNNHVIGCRYGILLANVAFATISNNVVRVNKRSNQGTYDNGSAAYGLTLDPQWAPDNPKTTVKVIFSNNVGSGGRAIFRSYHTDDDVPCDQIVFVNNVAEGTDLHNSQLGFDVRNATVINNLITNCKKNGNFRNCVVIGNQFLTPYYIPTTIDESDCCFLDNTCIVENNIIEGTQVYVNCDSFASLRGNIFRLTKSDGLIINCETESSYVTVMGNDYNNHPLEDDNITTMNNPQNITSDYSVDIDRAITAAEEASQAAQSATEEAQAASQAAQEATDAVNDAIETIVDISELAVPEMTSEIRGGAKLGNGLKITNGYLSIDTDINSANGIVHGSITSLTAKGRATQTQTTGKNLYSQDTEKTHINTNTWSSVGISYVKDTHGIIHATGTATANSWAYGGASSTNTELFRTLPAGNYVASTSAPMMAARKLSNGVSESLFATMVGPVTFTLTEPTSVYVTPVIPNGTTVNDLEIWLQVESGSTPTDYEPYTGGAPSPSPDYPQEIQVARGRNLLIEEYEQGSSLSVTVTTRIRSKHLVHVVAGNHYIATMSGGTGLQFVFNSSLQDHYNFESGHYSECGTDTAWNTAKKEFTATASGYVAVVVSKTDNTNIDVADMSGVTIQLELGSTPTPYVPYGHVGVEVHGRNLIDAAHALVGKGRNTSTGNIENQPTVTLGNQMIPVMGGEHLAKQGFVGGSVRLFYFRADGTFLSTFLYTASTINITVPRDAAFFDWHATTTIITDTAQIERGSTVTDYQPYFNETIPVPLPSKGYAASLPDETSDVLSIDGAGKVEWESAVNKAVLDGSENWTVKLSGTANWYYETTPLSGASVTTATRLLSSHYPAVIVTTTNTEHGVYITTGGNPRIRYGTEDTSANFKTWLSSNPVTLLHPLATPTTEQLGYIDWPDIPDGATVTCPELDALGVHYIVGNDVKKMAMEWYKRAKYELENRVSDLEQAVSDLVTS